MDIWVSRCNKTVTCTGCGQPIRVGEPCVFGKLWMRFTKEGGEPRRWVKNFRWHARRAEDEKCCWLEKGLDELSRRPHVETRGRRKMRMSKDKRLGRLKILRKRARIVMRLKFLISAELEQQDIDEIVKLGSALENLKEEIAPLGGAPKSWE